MCIFANFDEQKHIHFKWFLTKERPAPSNTPSSRDDTLLSHVITTATTPKFMQARLDNNQILQPGIQVCWFIISALRCSIPTPARIFPSTHPLIAPKVLHPSLTCYSYNKITSKTEIGVKCSPQKQTRRNKINQNLTRGCFEIDPHSLELFVLQCPPLRGEWSDHGHVSCSSWPIYSLFFSDANTLL